MKILLTNDDGFQSQSYQMLGLELQKHHDVIMISPERDCSGISHAFTLRDPLFVKKVPKHLNPLDLNNFYSFSGTPVDCVKFSLLNWMKEDAPDVVVSGINPGANMGCDVMYSGTVAAAMEASINGTPGIALSHHSLELTSQRIQEIIDWFLPKLELLAGFLKNRNRILNINYPDRSPSDLKGSKICTVGKLGYTDHYLKRTSPHGKEYFWLSGTMEIEGEEQSSDKVQVENGYIAISPLKIDFCDRDAFSELSEIQWN